METRQSQIVPSLMDAENHCVSGYQYINHGRGAVLNLSDRTRQERPSIVANLVVLCNAEFCSSVVLTLVFRFHQL